MANIAQIFKVKKFANFAIQIICELENGRLYTVKHLEFQIWLTTNGKLDLEEVDTPSGKPHSLVRGTCSMAEYWEHQKDFHISDLTEFLQNKYGKL